MSIALCIFSPGLTQVTIAALQPAPVLDQQARSYYSNQQYSDAAKLFQQAAQAYQAANDPIRQTLSLSNLSLAEQQLGQWDEANTAIEQSLSILTALPDKTPGRALAFAQALDIQASLLLTRGKTNAALTNWEKVTQIYQQEGKPDRAFISQTNQAQALQNLGLYRKAIEVLNRALALKSREPAETLVAPLQKIPATLENTIALRLLGDSLRVLGDFSQARLVLDRSLAIATQLKLPDTIALIQLSLGNTARAKGYGSEETVKAGQAAALKLYQQAASGSSGQLKVQAQLNELSLLDPTSAAELIPQIQQNIAALPPSRAAIEARINLAQTSLQLNSEIRPIADSLAIAIQQADILKDPRTQAYAIGSLGALYEHTKQWDDAKKLTQQALQFAQQINAGDVSYRWQWQLGRILTAQGDTQSAIRAYKEAVTTIKSLREDLAASSPDVQFSFRVAIEPIHRQFVSLLLKSNTPEQLNMARRTIEDLQLVELDNFFREACLTADAEQVDRVDQSAAVIYPIILEDQLAIIASLPQPQTDPNAKPVATLRYFKTDISRSDLEANLVELRERLQQENLLADSLPLLQSLYRSLIAPIETELAQSKVKTLVFVPDGALRNVPMAALHDGKRFLIEQYSIALTPGLQLLSTRPLRSEKLGALVAGISEASQGLLALPYVKAEIAQIQRELPSRVLLNSDFKKAAFQGLVENAPFSIVHLATHGNFSSRADETYILTWDGKLKIADLGSALQTAELSQNRGLELLVMSACETAAGDPQSALGLAGVAVRSGARSTVATLWRVNDQASSDLMKKFYSELAQIQKTKISRAEALRRAQLSILQDPKYRKEPFFWAAYILLGNWS